MDEVNDMDKRAFKNFITKRSSIWTLSLCITGILVLGGIAAVDGTRRTKDNELQAESELGEVAYLGEDAENSGRDIEDELFPTLDKNAQDENLAQASGNAVSEDGTAGNSDADIANETAAASANENVTAGTEDMQAEEAASGGVISEEAMLAQGISFTEAETLLWPSAGTILIDYSMDSSVYFPTLDQYKYNPALIIASEAGNQVLASAKGIVESVYIDDVTGMTVVLNIGNDYKLTYGQLKELAVAQGDVVEAGALLGYVSEPTKYYSVEGSNLYFQMTQGDAAVDPVLYLE